MNDELPAHMTALPNFVLARTAEAEAFWNDENCPALTAPEATIGGRSSDLRALMLAECAAKRDLVQAFNNVNSRRGNDAMSRIEPVLRSFARAHANHPDFDETWVRR